uniref:PH domain-containing protein n=1 Tax=Lutzomyia longipalpis TaxID=7200 RepID=A0A1B0CLU6_LUTLO
MKETYVTINKSAKASHKIPCGAPFVSCPRKRLRALKYIAEMFSMCSKALPNTPTIRTKVDRTEVTTNYDNNKEQYASTAGKQIKGGYLLRYKRQLLWNRWEEEWVVLYDDSTMAWFTEPGRSSPAGKILVKEAPEMLAIAHWTGQIPRRPPLPSNCTVSQLIALGSRRKKSKVYWMLAKSEEEVGEWISAISKTVCKLYLLSKTFFFNLKLQKRNENVRYFFK